jgi:hypothetical protein
VVGFRVGDVDTRAGIGRPQPVWRYSHASTFSQAGRHTITELIHLSEELESLPTSTRTRRLAATLGTAMHERQSFVSKGGLRGADR